MCIARNSVAGSCRRIEKLEEASKVKRFPSRRFPKEGHHSSRSFLYVDCIRHKEFFVKICHNVCVCVCVFAHALQSAHQLFPDLFLSQAFNFELCAWYMEIRDNKEQIVL
jgi:hypothetical protein